MDQRHHHTTLVDGTEQVTVEDCALGVVVHEVARVAEDELEDADSDNETCYDDPKCCSHSLKARFLRAGCLYRIKCPLLRLMRLCLNCHRLICCELSLV